ncbi:TPA: stage V sporulation T C-terminal domain-containing protein, partial [Streptococcus agalactiae]
SLGHNVLVCDRDSIIAVSGVSKKEYLNKSVGDLIEKTMEERKSVIMTDESDISIIDGVTEKVHSYTVGPIVANGDPIGAVIIFSKEAIISEIEHKAVNTAASFLAKQMEQ